MTVYKISREGLVERRSTGHVTGQVLRKPDGWHAVLWGPDCRDLPDTFPTRQAAVVALTRAGT